MSSWRQGFTVALFLSFPAACWGHGILRPYTSVAYYCPPPIQYVPVLAYDPYALCMPPPAPVYPLAPQPVLPGRSYAPPTAAPPSAGPSTPEPPLASPPAPAKPSTAPPDRGFGESTSFYDAYSVAPTDTAKPVGERCAVDFWNLTDRDLALRIEGGPPQVLPRGKSMRVVTGPRFTWQANGRPTQTTRVEEGESALQIVIRR